MKKYILSAFGVAALLVTQSCKTDFDNDVADVVVTSGEANFSRYVALGNSLTSGYRDNALYIDGQNESYPSMIAAQMKLAGGGEFTQPMMADNNGGLFVSLPGVGNVQIQDTKLYIDTFVDGKPVIKNVNGNVSQNPLNNIYNASKPFNNLGVPGAKSFHLVAPNYGSPAGILTGTANPYFARFASSTSASVLDDAMAQNPTFFSLWIGANDVLSYATNGGTNSTTTGGVVTYTAATDQGAANNNNPGTYRSNDISSPAVVGGSIKAVLDGLKSKGATKGVIANVPSITSIPYFTTVPYNAIPLDAAKAQSLNTSLYGPLKAILSAMGQGDRINLVVAGNNPVLIIDNTLNDLSAQLTAALTANGVPAQQAQIIGKAFGKARQAKSGELILLPASKLLGLDALTNQAPTANSVFIYGASYPIGDNLSLTSSEVGKITAAVAAFNASIKSLATTYNLAFFDANAKMVELNSQAGISWDGVKYSAKFVTGGTFSLDGVHLTGRGYAIVANEFLKAINTRYGSNLPWVDANKYSGVKFP